MNRFRFDVNTSAVPTFPTRPGRRLAAFLTLQALLWVLLTLAFAGLIQLSGLSTWRDALPFSATNWLPWIAIAPVVFWLSRRFPLERGHLLKAVPIHLAACAASSFVLLTVSAYFAPWPRGGRPPGEPGGGPSAERREFPRPAGMDNEAYERARREWRERMAERRPPPDSATAPGSERGPSAERRSKSGPGGYPGGGFRGPMPTPNAGFIGRWWPPFSGIALRANVSASIYIIIACFAHAFAYYRRAQDREREALALTAGLNRAKLDALRLQLQPHFLFNTLNAISTLVHRDANAADELIGDLSELLRLSLQTADHEVPLARELELLDRYLAIEQTRLGARLTVVRDIEPAALTALVPTFVLQPLAENAIRHGIEPRRAPGTLTLHAHLDGGNLRLVVADDGVGLKAASDRTARRGIGIANTEERLRALHGAAARLELLAPETGGVRVEIVLPRRTVPAVPQTPPAPPA